MNSAFCSAGLTALVQAGSISSAIIEIHNSGERTVRRIPALIQAPRGAENDSRLPIYIILKPKNSELKAIYIGL